MNEHVIVVEVRSRVGEHDARVQSAHQTVNPVDEFIRLDVLDAHLLLREQEFDAGAQYLRGFPSLPRCAPPNGSACRRSPSSRRSIPRPGAPRFLPKATGMTRPTLYQFKFTAEFFPISTRVKDLSFGHHRLVAKEEFTPDERKRLLKHAQDNDESVASFEAWSEIER